jgi:hypothetical protein
VLVGRVRRKLPAALIETRCAFGCLPMPQSSSPPRCWSRASAFQRCSRAISNAASARNSTPPSTS